MFRIIPWFFCNRLWQYLPFFSRFFSCPCLSVTNMHFYLKKNMISFFCSHDFLQIKRKVNQRSVLLTTICGQKTNYQVPISGDFVLLRFHTDNKNEQRGFDIDFMFLQDGKKTENSKTGRVPQIDNDNQLRPLILPSFQSLGTKPDNEEGLMGLQACPFFFFFF